MRAITISEPGGPEVLRLTEVPDPVPGPGEVLLEVTASGVNRADLLQRQGFYPPPPGASPYPGMECSGRVAALGDGVAGWHLGDQACALLAGGGYAELVAVPAGQLLPPPDGVSLVEAAALPEAACTVYSNVVDLGGLRAGETLLVHGGASGIGTMAIQVAKALGARVACTAGSPARLERCRELGADLAISYAGADFVAEVRDFTGGRGADLILDIMGAAYLSRNIAALADDGRLVVIGLQGGTKAEIDLNQLLRKRVSVRATSLRSRPLAQKEAIVAAVAQRIWPLVGSGRVHPVIHAVLPLAGAPAAHQMLQEGGHVGKIVLSG